MTTSPSPGAELSSHYRSRQVFLSSLPRWRRLLAMLNWRPTVELKVKRYAIEQRLKQLDELNSKLDALLCSSSTNSIPPQSTADNSEG